MLGQLERRTVKQWEPPQGCCLIECVYTREREKEARGVQARGGPCEYRHWHVRHDKPVWLGSHLLATPPSLLSSVFYTRCRPLKTFNTLSPALPVSHPPNTLSLRPLCVISCDLALSWSSRKCDWRAGELVVVGLQAP